MLASVREWLQERRDHSLFILHPNSRVRETFHKVNDHRLFEMCQTLLVLLSCSIVCLERLDLTPEIQWKLDFASLIITIFFVLEILVKVIGDGLVFGTMPYLRSLWNIFNAFLVVVSLVDILFMTTFPYRPSILKTLKILQLFRILRMMTESVMMERVFEPLVHGLFGTFSAVAILSVVIMFAYSIVGMQLFNGSFYYCEGSNLTNIMTKADCLNTSYRWLKRDLDFNSMTSGMLTMFVMFTGDGWSDVMYSGIDAVGAGQQMVQNNNPWVAVFFMSFMMVNVFVMDMFIGAAAGSYHRYRSRRREQLWSLPRTDTHRTRYTLLQMRAQAIEFDPRYRAAIDVSVFFSLVLMGLDMRHQTTSGGIVIILFQVIFNCVLTSEIVITLVGYGLRRFLSNKWIYVCLLITLIIGINLSLDVMQLMDLMTFSPTAVKVFQFLRFSQALRMKLIRRATIAIIKSLQSMWPCCIFIVFVLTVYACVGVDAFSTLECTEENPCIGLNRHNNFKNFGRAVLAVFRVFTGDNWSDLWRDASRPCRPGDPSCSDHIRRISVCYFVSLAIISQIILGNLLIGFIIEALEEDCKVTEEENPEGNEQEREEEQQQWGAAGGAGVAAEGSCSSESRSRSRSRRSSSGSCRSRSSSGSCRSRSSSSGELQQQGLEQVQEEQQWAWSRCRRSSSGELQQRGLEQVQEEQQWELEEVQESE